MVEVNSTYLQLRLHGNDNSIATLEFQPLASNVNGIWVRTSLTTPGFTSEIAFAWFLDYMCQRELASIYSDLAYGRSSREFVVTDTDCSFEATFKPSLSAGSVEITVEVQHCLEQRGAAIVLEIRNASAPIAEVQAFLLKLSQFS